MAPALPKDVMQELFGLAERLATAGHGAKGPLVKAFAEAKGVSTHRVYAWLRDHAGFESGRKLRSDCGTTRLATETLQFIAASVHQSVRNNGISTKPICVAMNIADQNGLEVNVSARRVSELMRRHRLDVKSQARARNHQRMRSLHPNHVHQIDPSLCLVYYLNGRQYVMREEEFNKNKPVALEKVKLKVWRYVRYDHASRTLDVRYFEAAGENQASLFAFLLHTWSQHPKRISHGVPKMLLWDKGSANTSAGICRLLDALGVQHETHATHHAWVKGGVENGNWIVERHFESRLRDEPVDSVEALNASAENWVRDYNANAIKHVDSRTRGDDGQPHVRDDLWNLIAHHPGALVLMPEREVCAYFMRGKEDTRVIRDGHITFVHPKSGKSELYNLQPWAKDFANGEKVRVSPMLLGECLLRVEIDRFGQDPLMVEVEPEREFDAFGRTLSATIIGEERRIAPHTAAQQAAKLLAQAAYGEGTSLEDAEKLKAKNTRPFQHLNDGKGAVAHTHLGQAELPSRLLPAGQDAKTAELELLRAERAVRQLTLVEASKLLKQRLEAQGSTWSAETYRWLAQRHPDGIPEDQLDALAAELTGPRAGQHRPLQLLRAAAGGE